jgi:hypothetical protein
MAGSSISVANCSIDLVFVFYLIKLHRVEWLAETQIYASEFPLVTANSYANHPRVTSSRTSNHHLGAIGSRLPRRRILSVTSPTQYRIRPFVEPMESTYPSKPTQWGIRRQPQIPECTDNGTKTELDRDCEHGSTSVLTLRSHTPEYERSRLARVL